MVTTLRAATCFSFVLIATSFIVGCNKENTVVQPTEDFQPTAEQAAFEQEQNELREQRNQIDQ